jgi:hypothetical protein
MIRGLMLAGVLIAIAPLPVCAKALDTAGEFLDALNTEQGSGRAFLRAYVTGVGEGLIAYNQYQESEGKRPIYCPPKNRGLGTDGYIAILSDYLKKSPKSKSNIPNVVMLFALKDAFPCK